MQHYFETNIVLALKRLSGSVHEFSFQIYTKDFYKSCDSVKIVPFSLKRKKMAHTLFVKHQLKNKRTGTN